MEIAALEGQISELVRQLNFSCPSGGCMCEL
jgi:hypothetical protein